MTQSAPRLEDARFPFSAIVGQEQMKLALLLNAINPAIGGVLIRGNKGTAKSTAVRALAALLPPITATEGCAYSCPPPPADDGCPAAAEHAEARALTRPVRIVDLPVGASEDRLVGSLDVERALQSGRRAFEPGILAAAHRGILYIDEVNLLSDHLVDLLLDAAAMGRNYVERDGISVSHPARFILIGTMNPEEGELRPQLLDRFGLMVEAEDRFEPAARADVVRRRIAFESDPVAFQAARAAEQNSLRERLERARALLPDVVLPDAMLEAITTLCAACEVDGLRADIVIYRTALTLAAWDGRREVTLEDVRAAAKLALVHRQRRQPFQQPQLDEDRIDDALRDFESDDPADDTRDPDDPDDSGGPGDSSGPDNDPAPEDARPDEAPGDPQDDAPDTPGDPSAGPGDTPRDQRMEIGDPLNVRPPEMRRPDQRERAASGRRMETRSDSRRGRHIGARRPAGALHDADILATVQAAAIRGGQAPGERLAIARQDLREKVRETLAATLILFVVDASGSMGARRRMEAAKGAVVSLLVDAYQHRDRVALIAFRGAGAELLLPPTGSVDHAHAALAAFATGGRTPLAAGLELAANTVVSARRRDPGLVPLVVLVSDGRANVAPANSPDPIAAANAAAATLRELGARALVIDTEQGYVRLGLARELAASLGGDYAALDDLSAETITSAVRGERAAVAR